MAHSSSSPDYYADEVRDHVSRSRKTQERDPHWVSTATQMLGKSIPFMIVGAVAGLTIKSLAILSSHEKEKKRQKVSQFRRISTDDGFVQVMDHISKFAVIAPNWMPHFCGHIENIFEISEQFNILTDKIKKVTGIVNETTSDLANVKDLGGALKYIYQMLVPPEYHPKNSSFAKSMRDDEIEREKKRSENVSEAFDLLKQYFDSSTTLIASAFKSRMATAGLGSELCEDVVLFNEYWKQAGPTIMEDPARVYRETSADLCDRKLKLAKLILQYGTLPRRVDAIVEDEQTMASIKWWMSMEIMFLPTMITVATSLGWKPPFDPASLKRRRRGGRGASDGEGSDDEEGQSHTSTAPYRHGLIERGGGVDGEPPQGQPRVNERMPGYAFVENRHQMESRRRGQPLDAEDEDAHARPSTSHSLLDQATFWKRRMVGEKGLGGVLQQPWAGFTPSVNDETYLPTSRLDGGDLEKAIMFVIDNLNTRIDDMLAVQKYMLFQANQMGDLRTYYLEKVKRGEENILELHMKWEEWHANPS